MHPALKVVIMFVIGCVVTLAGLYTASLVKGTEFVVDWLNVIEGGVVIAVLDFIFPAARRKQNRENLKDKFKKYLRNFLIKEISTRESIRDCIVRHVNLFGLRVN